MESLNVRDGFYSSSGSFSYLTSTRVSLLSGSVSLSYGYAIMQSILIFAGLK